MDQKRQIWITKSLSEQQKICAQNSGLDVKEIALTKIQHLDFPKDLTEAEAWIFTSQNALKNLNQTNFAGKVYASGKQTANVLKEKGVETRIGDSETAQSLAELIVEDGVKSALFFCGNIRRNELPNYLAKKGVQIKEEVVYHTLLDPKKIPSQKGDALFFMSPSAVESFAMMNEFDTELNYYSIGETTASTLRKKGVQKINTAKEASFEAMLEQYATQNK
tara:strand:+ start:308 stop:970 length:663 start_codon:yes stop_codon:yes gene_type:complete